MNQKGFILTLGLTFFSVLLVVAACSDSDDGAESGFVARLVDSVASAVTENLPPVKLGPDPAVQLVTATDTQIPHSESIKSVTVAGSELLAATDGGLVGYDLASGVERYFATASRLNAVTTYQGTIYVGGSELYSVEADTLVPIETGLVGAVNVFGTFESELVVGTTFGLYQMTGSGFIMLLDEVDVISLAEDHSGLWVGTAGQGLYRYDGQDFQKRFLGRDPGLFEFVTTLSFHHDHLYLGSPRGLFIYDGGRWTEMTMADGLPSNEIRSIDASQWVVYVATDGGLVTLFDGEIKPVERLEGQPCETVTVLGRRIIVGTENNGLLLKSGPAVKSLLSTDRDVRPSLVTFAN